MLYRELAAKSGDCDFCQKRANIREIGWETRLVRVIGLQGGKIAPDNYREYELRAVLLDHLVIMSTWLPISNQEMIQTKIGNFST